MGTEARGAELADPNDYYAEPDDAASADWAAESPRTSPLAHARRFDLIDDMGAVNPIAVRSTPSCGKMAKDGMAPFLRLVLSLQFTRLRGNRQ